MSHLKRRSNLLICLVLLSFFFSAGSSSAFAQDKLRISLLPDLSTTSSANDSYFTYQSLAGTVVEDTVLVINSENSPVELHLYAADVNTASSGGAAFSTNLGETPNDTGAWLNLSESQLTLQPNESRAIPFTFAIPPDATAGEYAAAIVAQRTDSIETEQGSAVGINLVPRIAVTMWVTIPGAIQPQLAITSLTAGASNTRQVIVANLRNTGNIGLKPQGNLTIREPQNDTPVYQAPIQMGYFLAGNSLDYRITLPEALPTNDYEITLSLTHQGGTVEWTQSVFLGQVEEARPLAKNPTEMYESSAPPEEPSAPPEELSIEEPSIPLEWKIAAIIGGFIILLLLIILIIQTRKIKQVQRTY